MRKVCASAYKRAVIPVRVYTGTGEGINCFGLNWLD